MDFSSTEGFCGPLRTFEELPSKFRCIFSTYSSFNTVQSQIFDYVFHSHNSVVIAAPTGSGKTVIFELALIKLLSNLEQIQFQNDFKAVYVCPVKALCRERFLDWNPRFAQLGISCIEVTGDGGDFFDLQGYHIIITTPEKWDSLTRKWRDNASLVQLVKLFMVDEVHLLSDNQRGPVLEAIVCRMKTVAKTLNIEAVRFIAVSATIYNVEDLAVWLGNQDKPAHCFKFGNEARPVSLQKVVKGYTASETQNAFLFDIQLSYKLKPLIMEHAKGKPTLIFCSTRKSVLQTSKVLSEQLTFHFSETQQKNLHEGSSSLVDNKLKELVLCGVGYHHAGLTMEDRHTVQNLFVSGSLPILVATSTLAMGVNLPAHLVIIKSTQLFYAGNVQEYPESSILQMIGRAGRPQFDASATAIIMTREQMVPKYERLLDSKEIVESSLHLHLPEHLNSEIVLFTITDLGVAMEWIRCTFLYVRAMKNPKYYGFDATANKAKIEKNLEMICLKEINALNKAGLIEMNSNGLDISPTTYGRLMSHFYLSFETFKIFIQMNGTESISEVLTALCEAHEFSDVQLRVNERKTLNELNKNKDKEIIKYPIQGKIKSKSMKVNCLIQACLGCLPIQDPGLHQESIRIVKIAQRLAKCLSEFLSKKTCHQGVLNATVLAKCLHAKLWSNSPFLSRQLDRIGPTLGTLLSACGKTSFRAIEESNPRDLERILNRAPPHGNVLQDAVRHLPKYRISASTEKVDSVTFRTDVQVSLTNGEVIAERNTAGDRHLLTLIIGDSNGNLLHYGRVLDRVLIEKPVQVSVVSRYPHLPNKIFVDLVSEQWVGVDVSTEVIVSPSITDIVGSPLKESNKRKKKTPASKKFDFLKDYCDQTKDPKRIKCSEAVESKIVQRMCKPVDPVTSNSNVRNLVCCFDVDVEILENEPEIKVPDALGPSSSAANQDFDLKPSRTSLQNFYDALKKGQNRPSFTEIVARSKKTELSLAGLQDPTISRFFR